MSVVRRLVLTIFRLVGFLAAVVAFVLLFVGATAWWAVTHPHDAWRMAERHFFPADLRLTWQSVEWNPQRKGWLHWDLIWSIKGLAIEKSSPEIHALVDEAHLDLTISIWEPSTQLVFKRVFVTAEQPARVVLADGGASPSSQNVHQILEEWHRYLGWIARAARSEVLDVSFRQIHILSSTPSPATTAGFYFKKNSGGPATFQVTAARGPSEGTFSGALFPDLRDGPGAFLTSHVAFKYASARVEAEASVAREGDKFKINIKAPFRYDGTSFSLRGAPIADLTIEDLQIEGRLTLSLGGIPGPLKKVDGMTGSFLIPLRTGAAWSEGPSSFSLQAPMDLFFIPADLRPSVEKACLCKLPAKLAANVTGRFWMRPLLAEKTTYRQPVASGRFTVESMRNRLFSSDIAASVDMFKHGEKWIFVPDLDSHVRVNSFKNLRGWLDANNVMVPAPFDVLDGTIDFLAKGPIGEEADARAPVTLKVDLASEHQKALLNADARFEVSGDSRTVDARVRARIQDLQLELPPLDPIAGLPKVTKDSRVRLTPQAPKTGNRDGAGVAGYKLNLHFEAATESPGSIRLLTKYASPNVPISLALNRGLNGEMTGTVKLEPFEVRYLRRTVQVIQLRMVIDTDAKADYPVDGRMQVDQTQYRIFIQISGSLQSPTIRLSSEPELPRPEIISVLLYDRTSDQLAPADAESAGGFEAAMADRAIGLFGLWALASTPVRHFSYNPMTKVYSATVQLADGLTADIGTDWEEATQLEVRKRISKRWVLTASYTPGETERSGPGRLVLQWEKRF